MVPEMTSFQAKTPRRASVSVSGMHAVQALEYQLKQGALEGERQAGFLCPFSAQLNYGPRLQSSVCLFRPLLAIG